MTTETNAERLEIIEQEGLIDALKFKLDMNDVANQRIVEDAEWLFKETKRAQELGAYCSKSANFINQVELEKENARLQKALEFYAREKNWHEGWTQTIDGYVPDVPFAIVDNGKKARQALKGESE